MGDVEYVPDWSSLLTDLLGLIGRDFCTVFEDFMACRGVCTSWRAAFTKDKFVSVSQVPLLMLAEKEGTDEREFYSLSKRKICTRIPCPDAQGKRCTDVGFGWILARADSGEVCLWKPFSSARIQLPNFKTFPEYKKLYTNPESRFIRQAWLTANPSEDSSFTLLVLVSVNILGFWRNGDQYWTGIKHGVRSPVLTCFEGDIYILDLKRNLLVWDPLGTDLSNPQGLVVPVRNAPTCFGAWWHDYLVGSTNGELLVITRNNTGIKEYLATGANHFKVMRLDLAEEGKFIEINDLGKDAIFLGDNAAVSVDATEFPGVLKPNCIYFTDDVYILKKYCPNGGGKDMGIYNVKDQSIERFEVESCGLLCPPLWIFPSF